VDESQVEDLLIFRLRNLIAEGDANIESICGPQDDKCFEFEFQKGFQMQLEAAKEAFNFFFSQARIRWAAERNKNL
jgi:hypothetical protein